MKLSRREFLLSSLVVAAGCRMPPMPGRTPLQTVLDRGIAFLDRVQGKDGSWRSDLVGTFRDGTSLTPLATLALLRGNPDHAAIQTAVKWLAHLAREGRITPPEAHGFDYPVYTAALATSCLSHPSLIHLKAERDTWLAYLRERQLDESLGWAPSDPEYGGWGYSRGRPKKPRKGDLIPPFTESNLSATTFALAAMTDARVPADHPAYAKALQFVHRCQNWRETNPDPHLDDGGFFLISDPVRSKAGVAKPGEPRFRSYGSATADGLRCLGFCGVAAADRRLAAANQWLTQRFDPNRHPGDYSPEMERLRGAVCYYYAASLAQSDWDGPAHWRTELANALASQQQSDGSWSNPIDEYREHEPIIATSFACLALAACLR